MTKIWTKKFLYELAAKRRLTPRQIPVFLLRHGDGLSYDDIEELHNIKKATAQKHMSGVYERFDIAGSVKGKYEILESILLELYQRKQEPNPCSSLSPERDSLGKKSIENAINLYGDSISQFLDLNVRESCIPSPSAKSQLNQLLENESPDEEINAIGNFFIFVIDNYRTMSHIERQLFLTLFSRFLDDWLGHINEAELSKNVYEKLD